MFFNKQIIWLLWAPIKTKAQKITIATATATAGKGWEKNIRNKDQATIVAHNKQMQLQVAVAVCSCSLRYIATATDTTHAYTYVERQSYCCCYCILTANANWLDKLLLLLLLLLLFNDRDRKMPPHFEAPLGIGCEKQRRRRCNACGLKYLIALYCGWMRRVLKIFTHKPHTHTLPHSVYFPCHTHTHTHTTVVGQLFIQLKLRCLSVCVFHTIFSLSVSAAAVVAIEAIRPKDIDALYMFYIYAACNFSYRENYYNCIV